MQVNQERKALLFGLAAVACWSTVATAFKVALQHNDVYQLVFYATLVSTLFLLGVVLIQGHLVELVQAFRQHWLMACLGGLLNPLIYYVVLFKAYDLLPAQVAMSINYSWAIVLSLMAILFLGQRMLIADILAAVICYGGVVIIATQGDLTSFAGADLAGVGLALLSTVIWASYWTLNIRDVREPVLGLCMNFLVALPATAVVCALFSSFLINTDAFLASAYVGLMEMGVAFVLWSTALRTATNASRISNLIFLSPFVSLVIINQVLGEAILPTTLYGLVLIIGGLGLQQYAHGRTGPAS